jgi:L-alanine-DL-glutamate epimerase-like enolase superfamily enzyme
VFADQEGFRYLEYPASGSKLAQNLVRNALERDDAGMVSVTDRPGLGVDVDLATVREFAVDVRIDLSGQTLFQSGRI